MGFYLSILLLRSRQRKFRSERAKGRIGISELEYTLWNVETVLNIGRVSAPHQKSLFKSKPARERAAVYFVESFFSDLMRYVNTSGKDCLVPPFVTLNPGTEKDSVNTISAWEQQHVSVRGKQKIFVEPLCNGSAGAQIPARDVVHEHNAKLKGSQGHAKHADIVFSKPLIWASCVTVAGWIEQTRKSELFFHLDPADGEAMMHFNMWKTCIAEMARVDAKVLFLFEDIHLTNVI